jgi:hypothetical protein
MLDTDPDQAHRFLDEMILYQFHVHTTHVMLNEVKHLGLLLLRPFASLRVTKCGGATSNWYEKLSKAI